MSDLDLEGRRLRLEGLLVGIAADAYLSSDPRDIAYLTGSTEPAGTLIFSPGQPPILVVPSVSARAVRDSAQGVDTRVCPLGGDDVAMLAVGLAEHRPQRAAFGRLDGSTLLRLSETPGTRFLSAPDLGATLRRRKDAREQGRLLQAIEAAQSGAGAAMRTLCPDSTELEIVARAEAECRRLGASRFAFNTILGSGPCGAYPNAVPSTRKLGTNSFGFIDVGPLVDGYLGDVTRAFVVGKLSPEASRLLRLVNQALDTAIDLARPGAIAGEVYAAVAAVFESAGVARYFPHHAGHGLGLLGAEPPWLEAGSQAELQEGDFLAMEPGLYVPGLGGIRLEEDLRVGRNGPELLTHSPRVEFA